MTLDMIFMLLVDRKNLRAWGRSRIVSTPTVTSTMRDADGLVRGRAVDGTEFKARVSGKSLARQLNEEWEAIDKALTHRLQTAAQIAAKCKVSEKRVQTVLAAKTEMGEVATRRGKFGRK